MKQESPVFGNFSENGKEYIINKPDTPAPWVNYMWNNRYFGLISQSGGGFSFYVTPKDNRLTRFRYNSLPWDRPGRYVYIREHDTGKFWSLTWSPTTSIKYQFYECKHGLGYTKISAKYNNIESSIKYFVPLVDPCEIWQVEITNKNSEVKKLDIFSYIELCLGNALNDLINQCNDKHFSLVTFDDKLNTIFATRRYWVTNKGVSVAQPNQEWPYYLFFSSSLKADSFDGSKDIFIGKWRSEENPHAIEKGYCENSEITYNDPCAALHSYIEIKPEETIHFSICMGIVDKTEIDTNKTISQKSKAYKKASIFIKKYSDINNIDTAYNKLLEYWDNYISCMNADTPDKQFNTYLNYWNKYQSAVTFNMARNAGYYHGGLLFGTGVRDQLQDSWGHVIAEPVEVKERIKEILSFQFSDGSILHNFFRLSGGGEKTGHSDTQLWIPLGIINYLKETGDINFLKEKIPYYIKNTALGKKEKDVDKNSTILSHLIKAIDFSLKNLTKRNLPKFGPGDWNDTLDYVGRGGKGETIWGACFLCYILKESVELFNYLSLKKFSKKYEKWYELIAESVNKYAWDGDWYIRGFKDNGEAIGSKKCKEGKIFLEPQSWAILSGISNFSEKERSENRTQKIIDAVEKHLNTPEGFQILSPAYRTVDDSIGLATRCVPGKKENGAVFNHPASWFILAEILFGNKDQAFARYKNMFPENRSDGKQELYKTEPYVYSEYITSREHDSAGEASHSWLTGTAVWMYRIGTDYILGIQPTYRGLKISPRIPSHWNIIRITRKFRGAEYKISIENPNGNYTRIKEIFVEGKKYNTDILPLIKQGKSCEIKVFLE